MYSSYRRHALEACVTAALISPPLPATAEVAILRTAAQSGTEPKYFEQSGSTDVVIVGLCIDLNRAIERVEPTIRIVGDQHWQPAIRLEQELFRGDLDLGCALSRTKEREKYLVYLAPPVMQVEYRLVARANDKAQIVDWSDVRRLREEGVILTVHGFGPVGRLKEIDGLRIDAGAKDVRTNLLKLLAGRGRFFYHRLPGMSWNISALGLHDSVQILPAVMDRQAFYTVVSRTVPVEVRDKLHAALVLLERNGELRRISDKWLTE